MSCRSFLLSGLILSLLSLCSCGNFNANRGSHEGYMTRSYTIKGQKYVPMSVADALNYEEIGVASWYNESRFLGLIRGNTSLGERVQPFAMSAAHKTLPLPCRVRVTSLRSGKSVVLRVNDRGPFIGERIIDLTPLPARRLGFKDRGLEDVKLEVLSVGDGKDRQYSTRSKQR